MRSSTLVSILALAGLSSAPSPLSAQMPRPGNHTSNWAREHRVAAADGGEQAGCRMCHASVTFCTNCHDAASRPTFHARNYVARHAEDAFTRQTDCASCHQTQAFCVRCHRDVGAARTGASGAAYHDAGPNWDVLHARVARRSIESCAGCHAQVDCLKCHSETGYARMSPHPAGLDLARLRSSNAALCRRCHVSGPPTAP
jgi:hypothetical protein